MRSLLTAIVFSLVVMSSFAVNAEQKIAIVDIKKIVDESSASKNINDQIKSKRDAMQKEVTKEEEDLRKQDQELAKKRDILAKEVFEQKAKDFRTKVIEAQRTVQAKRSLLEKAYIDALQKVREKVESVIASLAKEKGFSIAIPKSQVLYFDDSMDISDAVLKNLNKELPKVKVKVKK